ncbi:hypothetical protein QP201_27095, partial [Escherichia coli]|nr:hypothetical protein [Escherichia coli]
MTTIRLGLRSTTDDADGELIYPDNQEEVSQRLTELTREKIVSTINEQLVGQIKQVPSTFSAKKINGQRAYNLARSGED